MNSTKNNSPPEYKTHTPNKWYISLLSLGLISGSVLAGSTSTTLPNNAVCTATITSPLTGDEFTLPTGDSTMDVPVLGSASLTEGDPLIASFIYVMDLSGSTAEGGGTGCAPILDCEKQFIKTLNNEIIDLGISDQIGLAVYAESAKVADMTPANGVQKVIAPNAGPSYLNTVVDSTISYTSNTSSKITQFTAYNNLGRWTNCKEGLVKGLEVAQLMTHDPKIMVFASDGVCNRGTQAQFNTAIQNLVNAGVVAHAVAIGTESSCTTNQGSGSLAQIAQGTGGQCFEVPDPGNLPAIIPNLVVPVLDSLDLQIDGGTLISIPNSGIIPPLPDSAPITVNYNTLAPSLAVGTHNICVTAHCSAPEGAGSAQQCETINITAPANHDPVANPDPYTTNEDEPVTGNVLTNDTDADGDSLSVTDNTNPSNGTLLGVNPDGSFTYTPNANFCGTDSFTYTISDGQTPPGTSTSTVTITVTCVNDSPVAVDDSYTTTEDDTLTVPANGILGNDTDVDGDVLSVVVPVDSQPDHGTLTQNPDGSLTYVPNAEFCVGTNYTDSYTYQAKDLADAQSNLATVTITVTCVNDPPVANPDSYTVNEDETLTVPANGVLGNDTDPDGDTLSVAGPPHIITPPTHGTATLNADGSFSYEPNDNFCGEDSYTYKAFDSQLMSVNPATVTITVNCINDPPVANPDNYSTVEDQPLTVPAPGVLANDNDGGDGGLLTIESYTQPNNGTVTLNPDGSFTYTPAANFSGTDSFTYTISDGQDTSTATVTITVSDENDPPVATNDNYTTDEDQPLVITAPGILSNDSDPEGLPLTVAAIITPPSHGTLVHNPDGSFTYTPAANFFGTDSFTYTNSDGELTSNVATVTITVNSINDLPVAVDDTYTTGEDQPITVSVPGVLGNDMDGDGDTLTVVSNTNPSNGTVVQNPDGSLVYTPNPNFSGIDSYTYTISDGQNTSTATVTITISDENDPPVALDDSYTVNEDETLTVPAGSGVLVNDNDGGDGGPLTVAGPPYIITLPTHGTTTLNADGSFTYTPNANFFGTDSFTYKNSDGQDESNVAIVTITVNSENGIEAVNDTYSTNEDEPLTIPAPGVLGNDLDEDGDALTVVSNTSPSNGTVVQNLDGSFTYTPNANFFGIDSYTYTISDGQDTSTAMVTITVNPINDPPVAGDDSYTTNEDEPLTVPAPGVLSNDTDIDGGSLTVISNTPPTHGTLTPNPNGSFTYVPNANYCGVDSFSYTVSDGELTDTATVTITVTCINQAPDANDDHVTTNEDTPVVINVLVNDADPDGDPLTVTIGGGPSNGTLTPGPGASFTYTPNANFSGTDSFTYTISDGELTDTATVTITVIEVPDPPIANPDTYTTNEDQPLIVPAPGVLANDNDGGDGGPLSVVLPSSPPNHGTVALNPGDGSFTYTPDANYCGPDSFNYTVSDGSLTDTTTVTINVTCINDPPLAVPDNYSIGQGQTLTVSVPGILGNDIDVDIPYGDTLTPTVTVQPSYGSLTLNSNGSFTYTPQPQFFGTDIYTYTITDEAGATSTTTVTIQVICLNIPPVAVDDTYTVDEDQKLTVAAPGVLSNDSNSGVGTLKVVSNTAPSYGTLTQNKAGKVVYKPNANFYGTDSYTYTISNGQATSTATVTINVISVNDLPKAVNDSYIVYKNQPLLIPASEGVLINDSDVEGDLLTVISNTAPNRGTVTLNPDGSFVYAPKVNYVGKASFKYTISDGQGGTATATVNFTIQCQQCPTCTCP
ncbi:MAG: tandem-95 repeat protein [Thioploca sp.]|nr:tandem-95 repeat protein [Thioploca sp.]